MKFLITTASICIISNAVYAQDDSQMIQRAGTYQRLQRHQVMTDTIPFVFVEHTVYLPSGLTSFKQRGTSEIILNQTKLASEEEEFIGTADALFRNDTGSFNGTVSHPHTGWLFLLVYNRPNQISYYVVPSLRFST